ncbi:MAG TPA: glycosyltransferase family 2 protein [Candidatus Nanoarchaeia archaeon]|nr:hypothetical protein [uncultured archaeon]
MLTKKSICLIIPAFNEEGLITKTLQNTPRYVDLVICVDDASHDKTLAQMKIFAKKDKRVLVLSNKINGGVGFSVKRGLTEALKRKADYVVIAAGDNQCDLTKIKDFVTICEEQNYDVCRGNRFLNRKEIRSMPTLRKIGNSLYSFLTKFVSGYYSLFDFQSSFSAIRQEKLKELDLEALRDDYFFDNSLWINLNIVNARVKEIPVPVIYEDEVSDVNYFKFVIASLPFLLGSFLNRIYQKYILILHPVGIFLISGSVLFLFGLGFGIYIFLETRGPSTASTATVMLSVIPFFIGFQLILNAIVFDMQNEPK